MEIIRDTSPRAFADFYRFLFNYRSQSDSSFERGLLEALESCFGFQNSCVLVYGAGRRLMSGHVLNPLKDPEPVSLKIDRESQLFYESNSVFQAVSSLCDRSDPDSGTPLLFQSSSIIPLSEYDESEYIQRLNREQDVYYSAMLPFGPEGRLLLCLYKKKSEGDFSEKELELLQMIYLILAQEFASFRHFTNTSEISQVKDNILDDIGVGMMILDKNLDIIDYNDHAAEYIYDITSIESIEDSRRVILSMLFHSGLQHNRPIVKFINNYSIQCSKYYQHDFFDIDRHYTCVIIQPAKNVKDSKMQDDSIRLLSKLSMREKEIVELFLKNYSYQQIADTLFISLNTVRNHVQNIYKKLNCSNQRELIILCARSSYTAPEVQRRKKSVNGSL